MIVLVRFSITESLRFLSHAETLRLFQRACVRADLPLKYSSGYNPRPKISLPWPRSVGLESFDEVLIIQVEVKKERLSEREIVSQIQDALVKQLPLDCRVLSLDILEDKTTLQPRQVTYVLKMTGRLVNDEFRSRIKTLMASEYLPVRRHINKKNRRYKNIDLRPFLKSIDLTENSGDLVDVNIVCNITQAGSIRVDEILDLLHLDMEKLAASIRRTSIQCN